MRELNYAEAVNAALSDSLAADPKVVVYGEDVGKPGGVHGITRGLHREFGDRVFDTPISESAILGSAIGAATFGMRPVVEVMWADFLFVAFDQLINQAANIRYVSRGEMTAPITVRTQQGVGPGACAQHSQNIEALLTHIPGLRVAMPSNPADAYAVYRSAIACDDPTVIIDNRGLYRLEKMQVDRDASVAPIGGARVARSGADVTVVSWGRMVRDVLTAAEDLARRGIDVEVVDLRWLNPLDHRTVLGSIERTGRVLFVHEAVTTGGLGAELMARVVESSLPLQAPPRRLGSFDLPVPAAPSLLEAVVPDAVAIATAVTDLLSGPPVRGRCITHQAEDHDDRRLFRQLPRPPEPRPVRLSADPAS